jgi:hypothetical protein
LWTVYFCPFSYTRSWQPFSIVSWLTQFCHSHSTLPPSTGRMNEAVRWNHSKQAASPSTGFADVWSVQFSVFFSLIFKHVLYWKYYTLSVTM